MFLFSPDSYDMYEVEFQLGYLQNELDNLEELDDVEQVELDYCKLVVYNGFEPKQTGNPTPEEVADRVDFLVRKYA